MSLAIAQPPAVQAQQVVDTRYTQDVIPVLDTSKFEHMHRIAKVMAMSSVIPESLRKGKNDEGKEIWLSEDVVIANCFRIVNQAVRWGMDPFAVADCASIVHGRLMWEGKLVAAVIDAKLGLKLNYKFDEKPGQDLGVTVYATLAGETEPREIYGRVKDWHKGAKSPWANEGSWKRQLRYMGAREWCRAHAPAVILGVYTDDEIDGIMSRDVPTGQRALRMKDVTPQKAIAPLEIPDDIPDSTSSQKAENTKPDLANEPDNEPDELADPAGLLAKMADDIALCSSVEELSEIEDQYADLIPRLPKSDQAKAKKLISDAKE
jgi:hypothetical protein